METINGQFIMKGCDAGAAIYSSADAISLIHKIGFLPLFSNTILGFSIEEHTTSSQWWSGDPSTDPWEWRQILSSDPEIAYGKFFNKTAGFISKDFFPVFANYRRNGYDFDALFEDELVSYRSKKVMDVFELDDEAVGKDLLSSEVKQLAGFGKDGGEKNFEGALTDLQMQTYLIISSFRQKKNKKGQSYGWHLAVMETPETKWGRYFVTSHYSDDPSQSWSEIKTRMLQFFPDAAEKDVKKLLGIRYPGVEKKPSAPVKPVGKKPKQSNHPIDLFWPENLITEVGVDLVFPETGTYKALFEVKGQTAEIAALGLPDRVYNILVRAGLDTVEKIKSLLDDDPWSMAGLY